MVADETLYRRLKSGDQAALVELVARYHGPLLKFLYRQTGDRMLADDLVQETFTRLIIHRGTAPERFRAWVYTVAANLARDHFRSAYHRREESDPFDSDQPEPGGAPDTAPAIDAGLLQDAARQEVAAALQRLSPDHREVVILRFYHDLTLEEIAEIAGVPVGTVKSRLFHALKQLKFHLEREVTL